MAAPISSVRVLVWRAGAAHDLGDLSSPPAGAALKLAVEERHAIWLDIGIANDALGWFEGSVPPWTSMDRPTLDWWRAQEIIERMAGAMEAGDPTRHKDWLGFLELAPHVYAQGIGRLAKELFEGYSIPLHVRLLPAVGFVAAESSSGAIPHFWALRTNIAVIDDLLITIRLPDLLCAGAPTPAMRAPQRDITPPARFLPNPLKTSAADLGEAIGLHQAATTRAIADSLRGTLREIEARHGAQGGDVVGQNGVTALDELKQISELVQQVDRQLSRLLRRLGRYGEWSDSPLREVSLRYHFAVDETRSLQTDVRLSLDVTSNRIAEADRYERERFQFVAAALASVFLIPTLIAAIYGANVDFPGKERTSGFVALGLFVVGCASGGWLLISEAWARRWVPTRREDSGLRQRIVMVAAFFTGAVAATLLSLFTRA